MKEDSAVIPFTDLERQLLAFLEQQPDGLRMTVLIDRFCAEQDEYGAADIKSAVWRLLADRYLTMSSERVITRLYPDTPVAERD